MIGWRRISGMSGAMGCVSVFEGLCYGFRVTMAKLNTRGRSYEGYRIEKEVRTYDTEGELVEACRRKMQGLHGPHYVEVARLRNLCLMRGIDPDSE